MKQPAQMGVGELHVNNYIDMEQITVAPATSAGIAQIYGSGNNLVFQNTSGVTTIAGNGAGVAASLNQTIPLRANGVQSFSASSLSSAALIPMVVPAILNASSLKMGWEVRFSGSGTGNVSASANVTQSFGIYSITGSLLSLASSVTMNLQITQSAGVGGLTGTIFSSYAVPITWNITAGNWWMLALGSSSSANTNVTAGGAFSLLYGAGLLPNNFTGIESAFGFNSVFTTNTLPNSMALSALDKTFNVTNTQFLVIGQF